MGDCIETIVEEYTNAAKELGIIAEKWPEAASRSYRTGDTKYVRLWLVDMDPNECDSFMLTRPDREHRPGVTFELREVGVVMFKNVSQGINIAPKEGHYITASGLLHCLVKEKYAHVKKGITKLITEEEDW